MSDRPAAGEIFREKSSSAEAVYLHELADGRAARRVIGEVDGVLQRAAAALGARRAHAGAVLRRRAGDQRAGGVTMNRRNHEITRQEGR